MKLYLWPPQPTVSVAPAAGAATSANQVLEIAAIEALQPGPVDFVVIDFAVDNVTNGAYVQLFASIPDIKKIQIFMSSGEPLYLATGSAASEVDRLIIIPGGNGLIDYKLDAGERLAVRAVNVTTVNSGILIVNLLG